MTETCERVSELLSPYSRGMLTARRRGLVKAHLAGCDDCAGALRVIELVLANRARPPMGLETRIKDAVHAEAGEARRTMRLVGARGRRTLPWSIPLAAAAALAAVGIGLGVLRQAPTDDPVGTGWIEPYGALPASDFVVAGETVLSALTIEELERLLEEMGQ